MLAKVEVTINDNTKIASSIWWECITPKQFNWKMVDDSISLLFSAWSVLSGLSFSLLDSIHNKISVRQSLKVETYSCAFDCESDM